ncbi:hypothetical protein ACFOMD_03320 [Sphingoaurantiacus capsulatus]|uniref:Uncharacterized protein n=1 Tax=Sphingoaurantiacus capsulatus TaxID=1771310 RepID=A0ABV7X627_9SPHN
MLAVPAAAIGLGPLTKSGITDSDSKGFYLTLINPYDHAERFALHSIDWESEATAGRVRIVPGQAQLAGGGQRQLLVIVKDLAPGETYRFRVCGELAAPPQGVTVNARVCSKLVARRLSDPAAAIASLSD